MTTPNGNPIPILEFDPVSFDEATGMFNDEEKYKYIRCLRHYWYHTHIDGIPNDDDGLRQLCQCDPQKWVRLKGMIFDGDKFFYLENGKWHQKRARANYQKKQLELLKKQAQTMGARIAAGNVTLPVTKAPFSGAMLIFKQNSLKRVEEKIAEIKGHFPLAKDSKLRLKYDELKTERKIIMDELGLKA